MWKEVSVHALGCHAIFGEIMGGWVCVAVVFVVLTVLNIYTNVTQEFMSVNIQQDATV